MATDAHATADSKPYGPQARARRVLGRRLLPSSTNGLKLSPMTHHKAVTVRWGVRVTRVNFCEMASRQEFVVVVRSPAG